MAAIMMTMAYSFESDVRFIYFQSNHTMEFSSKINQYSWPFLFDQFTTMHWNIEKEIEKNEIERERERRRVARVSDRNDKF